MDYTVKKLSEISGVTVRALHFYEEAGLLKPAYYGSNGYRYYGEKELLQLQQILFFKELGFTLKQIRKVLGKSDFDKVAALHSHRQALSREWEKIGCLLKTIDKTIKHLKGKKKMKDREFFNGFSLVRKASKGESYSAAEETVMQNLKRQPSEELDESKRLQIAETANKIYGRIADCLEKGMEPSSKEVQRLLKEHCDFASKFHQMSKNIYKSLAQLYREHPEFRKQLDPIHPELAVFIAEAMTVFADKNLS
jgi:DNA-binding transcriptional MerR regulator